MRRVWLFRVTGVACLVLGLAVAVVGVAAFPFNDSPFLSRKGVGSVEEAGQYYAEIGAPATFALWYAQYFPSGGEHADAIYYNAGDLGFGREMHCYEEGDFTSCYVVNHGQGPGAPPDLAVDEGVNNTRILPTVAMVFDWTIYGQPNDVTFYVYAPTGELLNQVGLDSEGDKNVPHICLPCHGGTYNASTDQVDGANFLPFDAASFAFSTQAGFTRADQEDALRHLNDMVDYTFPDAPIHEVITGWYADSGGVATPGAVLDNSFIPPAYDTNAADRELYSEVVRHYCRTCHMAQAFDLDTPQELDDNAFYPVFETNEMPHTEMTAHSFWSSRAPAILARRFVGTGQTLVVTSLADTVPNGCDANCTLREAVLAANASADMSVIVFDVNGTFTLEQYNEGGPDDNAQYDDLDITEDLYILGNGPALTDLDANFLSRYFHIRNEAEVVIQDVTIRRGIAPVGGGLLNFGGTLALNRVIVRNNSSTVSGGGGLANLEGGTANINQSTFSDNNAELEGFYGGGAILNEGSILNLANSTLNGNVAPSGGALYNYLGSSASLRYVTLINNTATIVGGGLLTGDGAYTNVGTSIVAGNTAPSASDCYLIPEVGATYNTEGHSLVGSNGSAGGCPTDLGDQVLAGALTTVIDPILQADPATGITYNAPRGGSPILDAVPLGLACRTPSYDARNVARARDGNSDGVVGCDIGAVEVVARAVYLPLVVR